jgi:hypothetical protein
LRFVAALAQAGKDLARTGTQIEQAAIASLRKVAGHDTPARGTGRITTNDTFAQFEAA